MIGCIVRPRSGLIMAPVIEVDSTIKALYEGLVVLSLAMIERTIRPYGPISAR